MKFYLPYLICLLFFSTGILKTYTHVKAKENPLRLTTGAKSLLNAYNDLFINKSVCKVENNGNSYYSVSSTMPANEYGIYRTYTGKVTFILVYGSKYNDSIRNIWNYDSMAIANNHACVPSPIFFPYAKDKPTNDDVFEVAFVPLASLNNYAGLPYFKDLIKLDAVKLTAIKCIDKYYIENKNGNIFKKFPGQYKSDSSAMGIVCDIKLKTGENITSFLITNDMNPNGDAHVLWKQ